MKTLLQQNKKRRDRACFFFRKEELEEIEGLGMPIDYSKFNNIDVSDDDDDDVHKKLPQKKVCLSHVKVVRFHFRSEV